VDRSIWDIEGVRHLGRLSSDAPKYLKQPFCKTKRVLLAWGVYLQLRLPSAGSTSGKKALVTSLRISFVKEDVIAEADEDLYTYKASDDTYPILLAHWRQSYSAPSV
jgi:hypothetical protein